MHVVFVFKGGEGYKIYINGQLDNEEQNSNLKLYSYLTKASLGLGTAVNNYFEGLIDEVLIWNRSLSVVEISDIYNFYVKDEDGTNSLIEDNANDNSLISDNFESYADGSLSGQGSWSGSDEVVVQGEVVKEGSKAISWSVNNGDDPIVDALGDSVADGKQVFYMKVDSIDNVYFGFQLSDNSNAKIGMRWVRKSLQYEDSGGNYHNIKTDMKAGVWYAIQMEWRVSDEKARYRIDNESWTNWMAKRNAGAPDRLRINPYGAGGSWRGYVDYLSGDLVGSL